MLCINDGYCFQCWLVHLHEKVEVGVPVFPHVSLEEVDVCIVEFFSLFLNHAADLVSYFFCVASTFIWIEPLVCAFV